MKIDGADLLQELKDKYGLDVKIGSKLTVPDKFPATTKFYSSFESIRRKKEFRNKEVTISQIQKYKNILIFEFKETEEGFWQLKWLAEDFSNKVIGNKTIKHSNKDLLGL